MLRKANIIPIKTTEDVLRVLKKHRRKIAHMKVKSLAIFGSFARHQAKAKSDVDLLVEFSGPVGFFHFYDLKKYLESILHRKVDLVSEDAIRSEFRPRIEQEMIRAA